MYRDKRGLAMTAASQAAVDAFDAVVEEYLASGPRVAELLKAALAADPEMVLALCARGYFLHLGGSKAHTARAVESSLAAERAAPRGTARERAHVAALRAWCDGDLRRTCAILDDILTEAPRDILAARLAHYMHFYIGENEQMRDSVARIWHAWDEGVPGYGYVLGMRAFGLEETGDYGPAERHGKRAVEINPYDIWAGHCVCHVLEMQGRHAEGIAWVKDHEAPWRTRSSFANHVWWHRALYHLERQEYDAVLALYDGMVRAEQSDEPLDLTNAIAMLMRLDYRGVAVGDRWAELGEKAAARTDEHLRPFNDAHWALALAKTGRFQEAARMRDEAHAFLAAHPDRTISTIMRAASLALADAAVAYGQGDYGRCVDLLMPMRYEIRRIGGSHAQQDVFWQMLAVAARRAGRHALARALLSERTCAKPNSATSWQWLADAHAALGETAQAERAQAQAKALLAA